MSGTARKVRFNALPTTMRRRFVDALARRAEPAPVVAFPETATGPVIGWGFLAILGLGGLGGALSNEFGSTYAPTSGPEFALAIVVALFLVVYGTVAAVRAVVRSRSLPFVPGRYVFPLDIVLAQDGFVEWIPTSSITAVNTVHHHRNGAYTGTSLEFTLAGTRKETFWLHGKDEPTRILRAIDGCHARVRDAVQRADAAPIRELDLFYEIRGAKELDDPTSLEAFRVKHERDGEAPLAKEMSPIFARAAIAAAIVAVVVGLPTWLVRNRLSDARAFESLPTASRYQVEAYVRGGGRHRDEARAVILPAVVFREAMALRSATSLRAFLAEFPNAPQAADARAALHTLYDEAYGAFVAAAPSDPRLLTFMRALLTYLESSASPTVLVRFFPPSNEALAEEDVALARRGRREAGHEVSPIAPYFGSDGATRLESGVTTRLDGGFARVFAADVFHLTHGGRITGGEPDPSVAAFDVRYVVRPSGALYVSDDDQRAFVGIHVDFVVLMRSPGTATPYEFSLAVEPPETFTVSYQDGAHASESNIYATMSERAFDQLGDGLSAAFFASAATGAAGKAVAGGR